MFFVATAPLAGDGLLNLSPRGLDCLSVLSPRSVGWIDNTGSGVETIAIIVTAERISDSCGCGVPTMELVGSRDQMQRWADAKGPEAVAAYRWEKNAVGLDGLPGLAEVQRSRSQPTTSAV